MLRGLRQSSAELLCRIDKSLMETFPDFDGYQTIYNYVNVTSEFLCQRRLRATQIRKGDQWVFVGFTKKSLYQHSIVEAFMEFDWYSQYVQKELSE